MTDMIREFSGSFALGAKKGVISFDRLSPSEILSQLLMLGNLKRGYGYYYVTLLNERDEVLAAGAACALLDSQFVPAEILPRVKQLADIQAVRTRAFDYFMKNYEYDLAKEITQIPARPIGDIVQRGLEASFANDHAALARIEEQKFIHSGILEHLVQAVNAAEVLEGWKGALPLLVKLMLVNPQDGRWAQRLSRLLLDANQTSLAAQFCEIAETVQIFRMVTTLCRAILAVNGSPSEGLKLLDRIKTKPPTSIEVQICRIRALLLEKLGRFEESGKWTEKQNILARNEHFDRDKFIKGVRHKAALAVPELPPDDRGNYFTLLGFPRSGTTLLENVLDSHPFIETFEEIPAWASLQQIVRPVAEERRPLALDLAMKARARYYREIDHRKRKTGAGIFVDKLPMLSADAALLEKFFPQKKHIFSIRHPYDAVLSCFKQNFNPNPAMDNFTTFPDSCRLYDFTMDQWFKMFSLDSERVCYIRYDRLVENFQDEVTRALNFMGVEWDKSILQFAQRADERKARTPSYAKVRSGVSIGVQTAWRNYEFLFRKPEARQLDKWVKFFGYEGL